MLASFLEKLQSADDRTKNRWLIGSTALIGSLVVYVWLAYFNTLVAPAEPLNSQPTGTEDSFTFFEAVGRGGAILFENLKGGTRWIGSIISSPREYFIESQ